MRTLRLRRGGRGLLLGIASVLLLSGVVGVSPATAEAPWWRLSASPAPTNLRIPKSQVDELQVTATGGNFLLSFTAQAFSGSKSTGFIEYNAGAVTVQEKLEATLGAGTVTVSGGPGDETGSKPYVVKFTGELADQSVQMQAVNLLSGNSHSATVTQVAEGAPSGQLRILATNLGDAPVNGSSAPVTITDKLPSGLKAIAISGFAGNRFYSSLEGGDRGPVECAVSSVSCTWAGPGALVLCLSFGLLVG